MDIKEVKEEFKWIFDKLLKYDYTVLRKAHYSALMSLETSCSFRVFLALKHKSLFFIEELARDTLVAMIFFEATWRNVWKKEIDEDTINRLVEKFTIAFKPTEYKDAIEEIKRKVDREIISAFQDIMREEAK